MQLSRASFKLRFSARTTVNLVSVLQELRFQLGGVLTADGYSWSIDSTAAQLDLRPAGAAWGDMVGVALAINLGPLNGQTVNFLEDAAQGTAVYGASLIGQPAHQPFQGA